MTERQIREALADAIFAATDDPHIWQSGTAEGGVETIHIDGAVNVAGVVRALSAAGLRIVDSRKYELLQGADVDAIVNRDTADRLQRELDAAQQPNRERL